MRLITCKVDHETGSAIEVAISSYGLHIAEAMDVSGYEGFEDSPPYLEQANVFAWEQVRHRARCYCGDTGAGRISDRLTAAGISLLGQFGGSEQHLQSLDDIAAPV